MRTSMLIATWVVTGVAFGSVGQERPQPAGQARLAEARAAMGGADRLAAIRSLSLTGKYRARNEWFGRMPEAKQEFVTEPFEIKILLPDHCVERRDSETVAHYSGFAADTLLNRFVVLVPGTKTGATYPPNMIDMERANCATTVLALLLRTDTAAPYTVSGSVGEALLLLNARGTRMLLDVDPVTSLPRRLRTELPARAPTDKARNQSPSYLLEISDYQTVGDLNLPHTLTHYRNGVLYSERTVVAIEINPPLTPEDFKSRSSGPAEAGHYRDQ